MSYRVYMLAHNLPAMVDYIIYTFIFLDSRQYSDGWLFELAAYPANCVCLNQSVLVQSRFPHVMQSSGMVTTMASGPCDGGWEEDDTTTPTLPDPAWQQ